MIRRVLLNNNLPARTPRKVTLLKTRHVVKRLKFVREHPDWPLSKWHNILWSVETKVVLCTNTALEPRNVLTDVKHVFPITALVLYFG